MSTETHAPAERFIAEIRAQRVDAAKQHRVVMLRLTEIVQCHQRLLDEVAVIKTWVVICGVLVVLGAVAVGVAVMASNAI